MIIKKLTLLFALIASAVILISSLPVQALSGSDFKPGNIIDDSIFFNGNDTTTASIQNFLNSKVPSCDTNGTKTYSGNTTRAQYGASKGYPAPYTCLKDYRQTTPNMPAENGLCGYYGGGNKTAAEIIHDVGAACGINPKVLLVLLQKEQSLVTDDWPWPIQYKSATGYGCPDTAPCDAAYNGFFNQVYNAARQFKRYQRDPNIFGYKPFVSRFIQYSPNSACGGSTVYIENQATAGMYNYTPYQPNAAALNNLSGTGDTCSSYGNRNFWKLYNDWFGSTHGPQVWRPTPSAQLTINGVNNPQVAYGSNAMVLWLGFNVSQCNLTPGNKSGTNGFINVENITDTATYTVECTGPNGPATATNKITVQPPTFDYLRQSLSFAALKAGVNFTKSQALQNQISDAEKAYKAGNISQATDTLNKAVVTANGWVNTDRLAKSDAQNFEKAVSKLIATWPKPVANGGYPDYLAKAPMDSIIDPWGMYNRESVSYTAFKVYQSGRHMPYWGGRGNANQWDDNARASGIPVDANPTPGSVAISNAGQYGHAMYVESINADGTINVSQYSVAWDGNYSTRQNLPINGLVFIHF